MVVKKKVVPLQSIYSVLEMKDTKNHILQTAFRLYLQKSYKAVTLKDILAATGMSNGAFYHHFDNKEQLFKAVVDHYLLGTTRHVFEIYPKDSLYGFIQHVLASFDRIFDALYKNAKGSVNFFSFMFEALRYFPELQAGILKNQALETRVWLEMIGIARKKGEIKSAMPDESIAKFFIYASDGNRMDYVVEKDFKLLKSRIRTLWNDFYLMLKT